MQAATVSPVYVRMVLKGAIIKGYNPEDILQARGLPSQILSNPRFRISTLAFAGLSQALIELLRDESVGLLAKPTPIGTFSLMAKASLSCGNILESMQTWRDSTNWLCSSASSHTFFDGRGGFIAFDGEKSKGVESNYVIESLMTSCHRFHCWLANEFLPIERVELVDPEPPFSNEHCFVFYGAPVRYGQKRNAMYFSSTTLQQDNFRTREELIELVDHHIAAIMTQPRQSNRVSVKVRLWMERLFREEGGMPVLDEAAAYLDLTEQTLRRRLKKEGYAFKQIKDDTRRDVAMHYIKQSNLSVEEIGLRLGFSDASAFIRAFKKWADVTPLVYRKL